MVIKSTSTLQARPVGRRRISDEIAGQIAEMIQAGQLSVGDKLPTEAEMVTTFSAGRSAVREAIAQLREAGLVETRHGIGAFVCSPVAAAGFKIDPNLLTSQENLRQVLELRMEIEVAGAALAAGAFAGAVAEAGASSTGAASAGRGASSATAMARTSGLVMWEAPGGKAPSIAAAGPP